MLDKNIKLKKINIITSSQCWSYEKERIRDSGLPDHLSDALNPDSR